MATPALCGSSACPCCFCAAGGCCSTSGSHGLVIFLQSTCHPAGFSGCRPEDLMPAHSSGDAVRPAAGPTTEDELAALSRWAPVTTSPASPKSAAAIALSKVCCKPCLQHLSAAHRVCCQGPHSGPASPQNHQLASSPQPLQSVCSLGRLAFNPDRVSQHAAPLNTLAYIAAKRHYLSGLQLSGLHSIFFCRNPSGRRTARLSGSAVLVCSKTWTRSGLAGCRRRGKLGASSWRMMLWVSLIWGDTPGQMLA